MRNILTIDCIVILSVIVLSGCGSLPPPASETDTILLIQMDLEGKGTLPVFEYTLWFKGDSGEKVFSLNPNKDYAMIRGLAPGKYIITHLGFYQSGKRYKIDLPIELKPGTIHVAPFVIVTNMTTHTQSVDIRPNEFRDRMELLKIFEGDDNMALWKIESY